MSRIYRLQIEESCKQTIRGQDHVQTQLGLLEILPADETAELLRNALLERGFLPDEHGQLIRTQPVDGIEVAVDPLTGTVTVASELVREETVTVTESSAYDEDFGAASKASTEKRLREIIKTKIEEKTQRQEDALQNQVTEQLEAHLRDLQGELDQVVNRVTAEALKRKAASMGVIQRIEENTEQGSMTIVLKV